MRAPERKNMKKFILLSLLLLSSLLIVSCKKSLPTESSAQAPVEETTAPAPKTGKVMTIKLESNPSTGYEWKYAYGEGSDLGKLFLTHQGFESSDQSGKMMGAGGFNEFIFEGRKQGPQTITFTYKRNWEGGDVAYDVIYEVDIDKNLNITYLGKKQGSVKGDKDLSFFPDPTF